MNIKFNDSSAYKPGLIKELLFESYKNIPTTTEADRKAFADFDADLSNHPEWLGVNVFITTVDGVPIGFLSFDPRKKPVAQLGHNCILPEYRGKGLGVQQMKHALAEIQKQGFKKVILSTCDNQYFIPAQKMYRACGFVETGRFVKPETGVPMIGYSLEYN